MYPEYRKTMKGRYVPIAAGARAAAPASFRCETTDV
jgi:hypothetical protein